MLQISSVHNKGFSMIEVIIASFILSLVVLGYTSLQIRGVGMTNDALYRQQAINVANDLASMMTIATYQADDATELAQIIALYADEDLATIDCADSSYMTSCVGGDLSNLSACTKEDIAKLDLQQIKCSSLEHLPEARLNAEYCDASNNNICIYVSWFSEAATKENCASSKSCIGYEVSI